MNQVDELMALADEYMIQERDGTNGIEARQALKQALEAALNPSGEWEHLKQYGYAPGHYMSKCHRCGMAVDGLDKRAITCLSCAESMHAVAPPAQTPPLTTCNCRWDGDKQVQQCTLHEAHVDAIHEWAERAKSAEAKLKEKTPVPPLLTDEQIGNIHYIESECREQPSPMTFARAIESAVRKQAGWETSEKATQTALAKEFGITSAELADLVVRHNGPTPVYKAHVRRSRVVWYEAQEVRDWYKGLGK